MRIPIYQVDAFAEAPFEGNPAAICPLEDWQPDELLQSIAEENNLSETAFFVRQGDVFHLRWFTPVAEVELCGHATLATAFVLFTELDWKDETIRFETLSGELRVTREGERLTMDFPNQLGESVPVTEEIASALGKRPHELYAGADYMAVFESESDVRSLAPDMGRLKGLDRRGVIATAPGDVVDFVSRFFAPKHNIDEDPVTGSAHCAMAPYWGAVLDKSDLNARQISKRGGSVRCRLEGERILISGTARLYLRGEVFV